MANFYIAASITLFLAALVVAVLAFVKKWTGNEIAGRVVISERYVCALLAVWIFALNVVFVAWALSVSPGEGLYFALDHLWYRHNNLDTTNYRNIAAHWYNVQEGSITPYKIVFFPMYAIVMRAVFTVVRNYAFAGMIVSSLSAFFGGVLIFKLSKKISVARPEMAVVYTFLFPAAFFFAVPMTEGLFLLLSAACFYFLFGKRFVLAGAMGFLAALTRSQGFLLALPVFVEVMCHHRFKKLHISAISSALPVLGLGVYLLINYIHYGDFFHFMIYQQQNWHQQMGFFWNTAVYLPENMAWYFESGHSRLAWGMSVPNIAALWLSLLLIVLGAARLPLALTLYSLVFFVMSFGPTWLLSGPRYVAVLIPLALAPATIKSKAFHIALSAAYLAGFVFYTYAFLTRMFVY